MPVPPTAPAKSEFRSNAPKLSIRCSSTVPEMTDLYFVHLSNFSAIRI
jgi:hypothetical protein